MVILSLYGEPEIREVQIDNYLRYIELMFSVIFIDCMFIYLFILVSLIFCHFYLI